MSNCVFYKFYCGSFVIVGNCCFKVFFNWGRCVFWFFCIKSCVGVGWFVMLGIKEGVYYKGDVGVGVLFWCCLGGWGVLLFFGY